MREEKKKLVLKSLFSGIEGFALGLQRAGIDTDHYYSEIDKHAIAITKHNFKDAKSLGTVTDIQHGNSPKADIITFGSPCQDFSLAGKRQGLNGQRSSLVSYAIELISKEKPDFFIWENVKGVYSSNEGRDFQAVLQEFTNIGGYRLEWQLCNTKWVLPQNRERVYLIGHLATAKRSFKQVFPIAENGRVHRERNKQQPQTQHAVTITQREGNVKASNFVQVVDKKGVPKNNKNYASTLTAGGHSGGNHSDMDLIVSYSRDDKGVVTGRHTKAEANTVHISTGQGGNTDQYVKTNTQTNIRRLTPIECERLQGFPDNWTKYGVYTNSKTGLDEVLEVADTNRFKCCGNAVTVSVVELIASRLIENYPYLKK
jgi:DNA (cytosine-5)-methyltransferase 1